MSAEKPIFSRPQTETNNQQSEKLRRRCEAREIVENPTSPHTHIEVTPLQEISDVPWVVSVSIGSMKTLGGDRIAPIDNIRYAIYTENAQVQKLFSRTDIPQNEDAQAATLEAWGLAKEMVLKWAIMRAAIKLARDNHSTIFPSNLDEKTINSWINSSEFSGGKSVVVNKRPKEKEKIVGEERQMLMAQHALHITELNRNKLQKVLDLGLPEKSFGPHITAPDMGTNSVDMTLLRSMTPYVACMTPEYGGSGDPSPVTARGVFYGANAMLEYMNIDGNETTFAIQGAGGKVGKQLLEDLRKKYPEADIVISDLADVSELAAEYGARVVQGDEIFDQGGVFVPSGPSAQLNNNHLEQMKQSGVQAVIGPANYLYPAGKNKEMAQKYHEAGILVAPGPAVNLGGILSVASEYVEQHGGKRPTTETIMATSAIVGPMLKHILETARNENITPDEAFTNIALDEFASLIHSSTPTS